jgi:hypothetical protein
MHKYEQEGILYLLVISNIEAQLAEEGPKPDTFAPKLEP